MIDIKKILMFLIAFIMLLLIIFSSNLNNKCFKGQRGGVAEPTPKTNQNSCFFTSVRISRYLYNNMNELSRAPNERYLFDKLKQRFTEIGQKVASQKECTRVVDIVNGMKIMQELGMANNIEAREVEMGDSTILESQDIFYSFLGSYLEQYKFLILSNAQHYTVLAKVGNYIVYYDDLGFLAVKKNLRELIEVQAPSARYYSLGEEQRIQPKQVFDSIFERLKILKKQTKQVAAGADSIIYLVFTGEKDSVKWSCKQCTFDNVPADSRCKMCDLPKQSLDTAPKPPRSHLVVSQPITPQQRQEEMERQRALEAVEQFKEMERQRALEAVEQFKEMERQRELEAVEAVEQFEEMERQKALEAVEQFKKMELSQVGKTPKVLVITCKNINKQKVTEMAGEYGKITDTTEIKFIDSTSVIDYFKELRSLKSSVKFNLIIDEGCDPNLFDLEWAIDYIIPSGFIMFAKTDKNIGFKIGDLGNLVKKVTDRSVTEYSLYKKK